MGSEGEKRVPRDGAPAEPLPWHASASAPPQEWPRCRIERPAPVSWPGNSWKRRNSASCPTSPCSRRQSKSFSARFLPLAVRGAAGAELLLELLPRRAVGPGGRPHAHSVAAAVSAGLGSPQIAAPRSWNEERHRNVHGASGELSLLPVALPPRRVPAPFCRALAPRRVRPGSDTVTAPPRAAKQLGCFSTVHC